MPDQGDGGARLAAGGGGGVGGACLLPAHAHPFPHLYLYYPTHSILQFTSYNAPGVLGTGRVCLHCIVVE